MTPELRRSAIITMVTAKGELSIEQLAEHFGVSLQTVRGDVRELTEQGLLLRRHGQVAPFARDNIGYQQREIVNIEGKRAIGAQVADLLDTRQSCFLGTGTTVEMVARALCRHPQTALTVFTNNLHAVAPLSQLPNCELTVAGGRVRKRDQDIIGGEAQAFFGRYRVDAGVVSVGGLDDSGALYDFNDDEVMARQALVAGSTIRILVVDSSKFGRKAICQNGSIADFDYVVSDRAPSPGQRERIRQGQGQWIHCGAE